MPRVFFNQKHHQTNSLPASGLGKGGLGCSLLVAALLGGHRAESLGEEQADRQTDS